MLIERGYIHGYSPTKQEFGIDSIEIDSEEKLRIYVEDGPTYTAIQFAPSEVLRLKEFIDLCREKKNE